MQRGKYEGGSIDIVKMSRVFEPPFVLRVAGLMWNAQLATKVKYCGCDPSSPSLCPGVPCLSRARLEPAQPIARAVRTKRRSSSCRAPHLPFAPVPSSLLHLTSSWAAALLHYKFTVANVRPPSDCILPQSFFLGPETVCLCCSLLAIAVLHLLPRVHLLSSIGSHDRETI